jgi:hypothetical protein
MSEYLQPEHKESNFTLLEMMPQVLRQLYRGAKQPDYKVAWSVHADPE